MSFISGFQRGLLLVGALMVAAMTLGARCNAPNQTCSCVHGSCVGQGSPVSCVCDAGWHGPRCNSDVDECALGTDACDHGACQNQLGSYSCACEPGYVGSYCEQYAGMCVGEEQGLDPCVNGDCHELGASSYLCTCDGHWFGTDCEQSCSEQGGTGETLDALDQQVFALWEELTTLSQSHDFWSEPAHHTAFEMHRLPLYLVRQEPLCDPAFCASNPYGIVCDPDGCSRHAPVFGPTGPPSKAYLMNHDVASASCVAPPQAWHVSNATFDGFGRVHRYDGAMEEADYGFSFLHHIAGVPYFVISYSLGWFNYQDSYPLLWIHEWFHHWQHDQDGWVPMDLGRPGPPLEPEVMASVLLGRKVLRAGVLAATPQEKESALRTYLALRDQRRVDCPWTFPSGSGTRHVFDVDEDGERVEGTAMYTERKVAAEMGLDFYALDFELSLIDTTYYYYRSPNPEWNDPGTAEYLIEYLFDRSGWYATGMALGVLLDEQGVDWKSPMRTGTSQADVLENLYGSMSQAERDARIAAAKTAHGWNGLLGEIAVITQDHPDWLCPGNAERCCPLP